LELVHTIGLSLSFFKVLDPTLIGRQPDLELVYILGVLVRSFLEKPPEFDNCGAGP
jgi:hypothetical protein